MKALHMIAYVLLVIGGLNWGVFGLTGYDISSLLGGMESFASRIVYILVGLSALVIIFTHKSYCKTCTVEKPTTSNEQSPQM